MKKRFALVFHPSIPGSQRQAATLEIVPILVLVGIEVIPEADGQWEFQDPKLEVRYHIRPCFVEIFPYIGLI